MIRNLVLLGFTGVLSVPAHASLHAFCDIWTHDRSGLNLRMNMTLTEQVGAKSEKLGVSPSVITLVDESNEALIFSQSISELNRESSEGYFEIIDKKAFPRDGSGKRLAPVVEKVRRLSVMLEMKPNDRHKFEGLTLTLEPQFPDSGAFDGSGSLRIGGKEYRDVTYTCSVYIDWGSYKRALRKAKGPRTFTDPL